MTAALHPASLPMTDAETLHGVIADLRRRGITLSMEAGDLKVSAPKGSMDEPLLRRLRAVKPALVRHLAAKETPDSGFPEAVPAADPTAPYPLSDLQRGFHLGSDPGMEFHVRPHCYMEWDMADFDADRYEAAWNAALERRARSLAVLTVGKADGVPCLAPLARFTPIRLLRIDLRGLTPDAAARSLAATRAAMERDEPPLDRWPWADWRVSLLEGGRARVHYNHNSFFSDGVGTQRLLREVLDRYRDPSLILPPLAVGFGDCLAALARLETGTAGERARAYWMARIDTLPPPPPLPQLAHVDRRRRSRLHRRDGCLPAERWHRLKEAARARGLSPTVAVYTAYGLVLAHWSGSRHFILNQMITRRFPMHEQIMEVMGNFVSLYPLEIDLRGDEGFTALARRLQDRLNADMEHLAIGGMEVLAELNRRKGSPGRVPVPYVVASGLAMPGAIESDYSCLETPQTQLDHQFWELSDGRMLAQWDVLEEFFPIGMIDALWNAYFGLLDRLAGDPAAWDEQRWALTPPEQVAVRERLNAEARLLPGAESGALLHDGLFRRAAADPDRIALIADGIRFSYDALAVLATALARRIRRTLGPVAPGRPIVIAIPKGWEQVVAVHAVLLSGHVYVPVAPDLPQARMHQTLALAGSPLALVTPRLGVPESLSEFPVLPVVDDPSDTGPVETEDPPFPRASAEEPAYIIFTSGSTGVPKGVAVSHAAALNTITDINRRFDLTPDDRVFGISALTFDLSVYDLFGPPLAGAAVILPTAGEERAPDRWAGTMARHRVTVWNSAPALLQLLVATLEATVPQQTDALTHLRLALLSGDWIPVGLPDRLRTLAPPGTCRIISLGGATEAAIWSIWYEIGTVDPAWASIPYGTPLAHQGWHVLDTALNPCPDWVPGELFIEGRGLAIGYWGDPEKTAASFITHPETGVRLYRTGDLGRAWPDGCIEFLGRRDGQVKVQGFRIELGDVEAALSAHPAVTAAVAFVRGEGEAGRQLAACVTVSPESMGAVDAASLRRWAAARLPVYMVPDTIRLLDRLPLSVNGKIDRKALAVLDPPNGDSREVRVTTPPRTLLEAELHALWTRLLTPAAIFGVEDDFFDLGGHSFLAVGMVDAINRKRAARGAPGLVLGDLMTARTIAVLAHRLEALDAGAAAGAGSGAIPLHRGERLGPPLFLIHPAAGGVMCYRDLAARLSVPCYGIEAAGLSGEVLPLSDLPAMVERSLARMRVTKPVEAPWRIGGWSSGGVIAAAIAARLEADGERVEGLVLIDSPSPTAVESPDEATLLRFFLEDLDIGYPMERLAALPRPDLALALEAAVDRLPALPGHTQLEAVQRVFEGVLAATGQCRVAALDGPILVIKAGGETASEFARHPDRANDDWGWSRIGRGPVIGTVLPATHHGLLRPPTLDETAARMSGWLERLAG